MTRGQFVTKFHWTKVMWIMGILNIVALVPQPLRIWQTGEAEGVSIEMFALFFIIQLTFGVEFFLKRSWGPMVSMLLSAMLSLTTICLVLAFR